MQSRFIVFEGPDGAGTTLHSSLLAEHLRGNVVDVFLTHEPTDGAIGSFIRQELSRGVVPPLALQMLFCADRAWHIEKEIAPALKEGKTVISDRYALSTIVYGQALGLDPLFLNDLNKKFIQPDMLILLLPSFNVCQDRLAKRLTKDMLEESALQRKVYDGYLQWHREHPEVPCIDTAGTIDMVAAEILQMVGDPSSARG